MTIFGFLDDRRSRAHLRSELIQEGRAVSRTLQLAMEDNFRDRELEDLRELVDKAS